MTKIKNIPMFIGILISIMILSSCEKDEVISPTDNSINIEQRYNITKYSSDTLDGNIIDLYLKSSKSGYNQLIFTVKKDNNLLMFKDSKILLEMAMMNMKHSCPTENIIELENGVYSCLFTINMPSNEAEAWTLNLDLTKDDNSVLKFNKKLDFNIEGNIKMFKYNNTTYLISDANLGKFKVGINDYNFKLSYKETGYIWPDANDLTIEVTPWMASMGHGSPNNVNPISVGNGYYKGKVNLTMSGDWEIQYKVKKEGIVIFESKFDYWID